MRRDDAAGLLEIAQLEGDGGANDRILPFIGDRQPAHPIHPIVARAVGELPACGRQPADKWFVGADHAMNRAGKDKRRFALDEG
jgi:hypothetical protein